MWYVIATIGIMSLGSFVLNALLASRIDDLRARIEFLTKCQRLDGSRS